MQKNKLSKMEYAVTQLGETEPPFSHCGFPDREGDFFVFAVKKNYFLQTQNLRVVQVGLAFSGLQLERLWKLR